MNKAGTKSQIVSDEFLASNRNDAFPHIGLFATDPRLPDNPIVDCNEAFLDLTGYDRHEVIGRNCRFLAGPGTDLKKLRLVSEVTEEQEPIMVELLFCTKDGTPFLNAVMVAPIYDVEGDLTGYLGLQFPTSRKGLKHVTPANDRVNCAKELVACLSQRQIQVLQALTAGTKVKQTANELKLSERTVKMHRALMLKALGVTTNAEAIRIGVEAGLLLTPSKQVGIGLDQR